MWVLDIRNWLDDTQFEAASPQLRSKVKKLTEIITFATSVEAGLLVNDPPTCWRRPKRKPCIGILDIELIPETGLIFWECPVCQDEGNVSGWEDLIWDISAYPSDLH